jgi:hypothetical protein
VDDTRDNRNFRKPLTELAIPWPTLHILTLPATFRSTELTAG